MNSNEGLFQRPLHLRPTLILLVFCGGTLGTAARQALSLLFPRTSGIPWTIFAINIAGAFVLGLLLELLIRKGPDTGSTQVTRLLLGTGFLGGFTTYSALAVDTVALMDDGSIGAGILYSVMSVLIGLIAAAVGVFTASTVRAGRTS